MTSLPIVEMTANELFEKACVDGNLDMAKSIQQNMRRTIPISTINDIFYQVCKSGRLDVVQWLYMLEAEIDIDSFFVDSCRRGDFKVVQLLYMLKPEILDDTIFLAKVFLEACVDGNLDMAKWIRQNMRKPIPISTINNIFYQVCKSGHLDVVQWLWTHYSNVNIESGFGVACGYGHLEVIQWLYTLKPEMDITGDILYLICDNGSNLPTLQWLYAVRPEISEEFEIIFSSACRHGRLEIAHWIYDCDPEILDDAIFLVEVFLRACKDDSNLPVLQWLYALRPEISEEFESAFSFVCARGNLAIARWIYHSKPEVLDDAVFLEACENRLYSIVQWIHEVQPERYQFIIEISGDIEPVVNMVLSEKQVSEITQCVICYEDTSDVITSCNHQYCTTCIQESMRRQRCCAYCRKSLVFDIDLFKIVCE